MSSKLRELIKNVRSCKTAAEERAIITKESALIRTAFKEEIPEYRERNVAKLLYIHMLGYPTHFGQMECIKLLASTKFADKRIGYLALMLLLDEKQETLMLVTNSLQQDLNSSNQFAVGLALTSIGNICGSEMARDLAGDVERALKSVNPYIRKKAALAAIRMLKKVPELIDQFLPTMVQLLLDKNHAVLLTGVALVQAVVDTEPAYSAKLQKLIPALVKILRKLITPGYSPEYDVGGVSDPFLQSRILALMRSLARNDAGASEGMNAVLAQVASQTDSARNAGNSILYETVNTIMASEHSEEGLRVLAINILGKFLTSSKDNNIRYVALSTLCRVVHRDATAVQRHRAVIVECLKDTDVSIRKRALELAYALVSPDNVRSMTKELLAYLSASAGADEETRADICVKIAAVVEKFSPSLRWRVDTLMAMLSSPGNAAKGEVLSALVFHITHAHTPAEHASIVHKLYTMGILAMSGSSSAAATGNAETQQQLLQVAVWCVGEYGQHLLRPPPPLTEGGDGGAGDVTGPFGEQRHEADLARFLERVKGLHYVGADSVGMVLVAALKLTVRLAETAVVERLKKLITSYGSAANVELQTRSVEFGVIVNPSAAAGGTALSRADVRSGLLESMPLLDESVLRLRSAAGTGETATDAARLGGEDQVMAVAARGSVARPVPATAQGDDMLGLGGSAPTGSRSSASAAASALADLDDLFGTSAVGTSNAASSGGAPQGAFGRTAGLGAPAGSVPTAPVAKSGGTALGGDLDDLFGMGPSSSSSSAAHASVSSAPPPAPRTAPGGGIGDLFGPGPATTAGVSSSSGGGGKGMGSQASAGLSSVMGDLDDLLGASTSSTSRGGAAFGTGGVSGVGSLGGMGGIGGMGGMGGGGSPAPAPLFAPSPTQTAMSTGGMGVGMPSSTPSTATAGAASFGPFSSSLSGPASFPPFVAFESSNGYGLRVSLACVKLPSAPNTVVEVTATYACTGGAELTGFMCQVAVPKTMKLTLLPASAPSVAPASTGGAPVVQVFKVDKGDPADTGNAAAAKPLALRLKFTYTPVGAPAGQLVEQVDVKNFPAGL